MCLYIWVSMGADGFFFFLFISTIRFRPHTQIPLSPLQLQWYYKFMLSHSNICHYNCNKLAYIFIWSNIKILIIHKFIRLHEEINGLLCTLAYHIKFSLKTAINNSFHWWCCSLAEVLNHLFINAFVHWKCSDCFTKSVTAGTQLSIQFSQTLHIFWNSLV